MARTLPFRRTAAHHSKTMLLPMQRASVDELSLRYHLALDALGRGAGTLESAQLVTEAVLSTGFLKEAGYGAISYETIRCAEQHSNALFQCGKDDGEWRFDDAAHACLAQVLTAHDQQLFSARLADVIAAADRLDRLKAGLPDHVRQQKRA